MPAPHSSERVLRASGGWRTVPATNQPALRKYSGIVVHFGPASQSTVGWEEKEEKGEKESKTEEMCLQICSPLPSCRVPEGYSGRSATEA